MRAGTGRWWRTGRTKLRAYGALSRQPLPATSATSSGSMAATTTRRTRIVVRAIADGIREVDPRALHTAHCGPGDGGARLLAGRAVAADQQRLHLRACRRLAALAQYARPERHAVLPDRERLRERARRRPSGACVPRPTRPCSRARPAMSSATTRSGTSATPGIAGCAGNLAPGPRQPRQLRAWRICSRLFTQLAMVAAGTRSARPVGDGVSRDWRRPPCRGQRLAMDPADLSTCPHSGRSRWTLVDCAVLGSRRAGTTRRRALPEMEDMPDAPRAPRRSDRPGPMAAALRTGSWC